MTTLSIIMIVSQVLLNKALQDVWAMLSAQAIIIHLIILKVAQTVPGNMQAFNEQMSQKSQRDMYPTDLLFGVFDLTEKDSPIEHFEVLGYEGANFIPITGSAIVNIALLVLIHAGRETARCACRRLYKYECARRLGVKLESVSLHSAVLNFYLQSYLEMAICVLVCWGQQITEDFTSGNASDFLSALFLVISALVLGVLPIYIVAKLVQNKDHLHEPETRERYGYLYESLGTQSVLQAIFHVIFVMRRALFVLILVSLEQHAGSQICLQMVLTGAYTVCLIQIRPFEEKFDNQREIFNEVCVMLVLYCYAMTTSTQLTGEDRYSFGWVYVLIASFGPLINFGLILEKLAFEVLPQLYRAQVNQRKRTKYEQRVDRWLESKKRFCQGNPGVIMVDEIGEAADLQKRLIEGRCRLLELESSFQTQRAWLDEMGLDKGCLSELAEELGQRRLLIKELEGRQRHLDLVLYLQFRSLKPRLAQKAMKDSMKLNLEISENHVTFEQFCNNYQQHSQVYEARRQQRRAVKLYRREKARQREGEIKWRQDPGS